MALDNKLYYFDKETNVRHELGEIQCGSDGFNQSYVLDGTKDSFKCVLQSYDIDSEIEPFTIIQHIPTNSFWIVSHDNVSRTFNENGTFYYTHELQLLGAIELLNARDLTDLGFNYGVNFHYTFEEFINRLFARSTFEYSITINYNSLVDKDQVVDYLKTFENYTLLSAIREFLDGYNLSANLTFSVNSDDEISGATLNIISKVGDINRPILDINNAFQDVRQTRTMDKNSFGTTVVSNAENVVSTLAKSYPTIGSAKLSADAYNITHSNAMIRLPSKVHHVNWVKMYDRKQQLLVNISGTPETTFYIDFDNSDHASVLDAFDKLIDNLETLTSIDPRIVEELNADKDYIVGEMENYGVLTFYNTTKYDPIANAFYEDFHINNFRQGNYNSNWVLGNKKLRDGVANPQVVMYWEQGSDLIKGFDFWDYWHINGIGNENRIESNDYHVKTIYNAHSCYIRLGGLGGPGNNLVYNFHYVAFVVNYVPMSDLKVKLDNSGYGKDIQLYNQNGRLTDSNGFSKLLNSYAKEITSTTITKYRTDTRFATCPKVGTLVKDSANNKIYVINNVSLDFYPSEGENYFIVGEYTMSLNVATKSLMTNPNSNIRDYGIPQTNTVKRKQLYRDFWEFDYVNDPKSNDDWYLPIGKVFDWSAIPVNTKDHIAVINTTWYNNSWYYQLDTIKHILKKSMYEIVDFKDNNIIGYDMQTQASGFDLSRVLSDNYIDINTPVSYVDERGYVYSIYVCFCTASQMLSNYTNQAIKGHCFIDQGTFENCESNCDFEISEPGYEKDPLEIPVFEYSCQIDDSDNVLIGDDIFFDNSNHNRVFYSYAYGPKDKVNQLNATNYAPQIHYNLLQDEAYVDDGVIIEVSGGARLLLNLKHDLTINYVSGEITYGSVGGLDRSRDLIVFRNVLNSSGDIIQTTPIMILKNTNSSDMIYDIDLRQITLIGNRYTTK